ncbi:MAG: HAD-IIB family hydrolase [Candidatus Sedimenticola sp. 20ELBAFRAG]
MTPTLLIFSDMDGSLLDHYSYSHAPADPMLKKLELRGVPMIPATSKTRAELLELRRTLKNPHPFIVENGAAVFIPEGYFKQQPAGTRLVDNYWVKSFCAPRQQWLDLILDNWADFSEEFTTFAESSIEEISEMTGLKPTEAKRASLREYGEPVRWNGGEEQLKRFSWALERKGAYIQHGARFIHVSGKTDKGMAMQWLTLEYMRQPTVADCYTIAIGDGKNDIAMLETADHALVIRSPAHDTLELSRPDSVVVSEGYGPTGWAEGMETILESLPFSTQYQEKHYG